MKQETLELIVYISMCMGASYLLMRKYRAYISALTHRLPSENWGAAWKRGTVAHKLNLRAQTEMFGSRMATVFGQLVVVGIALAELWCIMFLPSIAVLIVVYIGWGLFATRKLGFTGNVVYARLLKRDRLTYRLLHALLWPVHVRSDDINT